jgi:hypothetical protein
MGIYREEVNMDGIFKWGFGCFWAIFFFCAYLLWKAGTLYWIGMTFVQPLLPADSKVDGGQALIAFLILLFFTGGFVVVSKK